jgi:hypothetical protein
MVQIVNPREMDGKSSSSESLRKWMKGEGEAQKKMEWLFLSPLERKRDPDWNLGHINDPGRILIGSHYYWIRVLQSVPELCRMADRKDSLVLYEVLHHENLGISADDLEDAVRQANGELMVSQEYPVSDHVKRKLQILNEP